MAIEERDRLEAGIDARGRPDVAGVAQDVVVLRHVGDEVGKLELARQITSPVRPSVVLGPPKDSGSSSMGGSGGSPLPPLSDGACSNARSLSLSRSARAAIVLGFSHPRTRLRTSPNKVASVTSRAFEKSARQLLRQLRSLKFG